MMLSGKISVVTGGSRGIGRETALRLAGYGAEVVINYCGSKDKAKEALEAIKTAGGNGMLHQADMKDVSAVDAMFKIIIEKYGRIDILVNNAGITRDNLILKMTEEEFNDVIDTNLKGAFYCMRQASKIMLKQKSGRIINLSSISAVIGNAGQVNYCASKAGIIGMTKSLARELGSRGITVNAVAPGFITTDMTDKLSDKIKENVLAQIPLRRMGTVKEVAETICFLASDNASYITGQTIMVDGGMA